MISCTEAVRQMWEYIESELDPVNQTKVEAHLDRCRRCCGELEFAKELQRFMARKPDLDIPPSVTQRFESVLQELDGKEGAN